MDSPLLFLEQHLYAIVMTSFGLMFTDLPGYILTESPNARQVLSGVSGYVSQQTGNRIAWFSCISLVALSSILFGYEFLEREAKADAARHKEVMTELQGLRKEVDDFGELLKKLDEAIHDTRSSRTSKNEASQTDLPVANWSLL